MDGIIEKAAVKRVIAALAELLECTGAKPMIVGDN
jgi:hypothetical protein